MKEKIIVDTGPLVALINQQDAYHEWVKQQLIESPYPLLTCEAVLTEAAFLLRNAPKGIETLLAFLTRGLIKIAFFLQEDVKAISTLVPRYGSVPMSLADACSMITVLF
jgi:predicted nucleic acid-binding protein